MTVPSLWSPPCPTLADAEVCALFESADAYLARPEPLPRPLALCAALVWRGVADGTGATGRLRAGNRDGRGLLRLFDACAVIEGTAVAYLPVGFRLAALRLPWGGVLFLTAAFVALHRPEETRRADLRGLYTLGLAHGIRRILLIPLVRYLWSRMPSTGAVLGLWDGSPGAYQALVAPYLKGIVRKGLAEEEGTGEAWLRLAEAACDFARRQDRADPGWPADLLLARLAFAPQAGALFTAVVHDLLDLRRQAERDAMSHRAGDPDAEEERRLVDRLPDLDADRALAEFENARDAQALLARVPALVAKAVRLYADADPPISLEAAAGTCGLDPKTLYNWRRRLAGQP